MSQLRFSIPPYGRDKVVLWYSIPCFVTHLPTKPALLKLISTDGFQTSGLSSKRLIFQSDVLPVKEPLLHHLQIVPLASEKTKLLLL